VAVYRQAKARIIEKELLRLFTPVPVMPYSSALKALMILLLTGNASWAADIDKENSAAGYARSKYCVYELLQETAGRGQQRVYFTSDAVRIEQLAFKFTVLSKGPKWDVFIYRPDKNQYSQIDYAKWCRSDIWKFADADRFRHITASRSYRQQDRQYIAYEFKPYMSFGDPLIFKSQNSAKSQLVKPYLTCLATDYDIHPGSVAGHLNNLPEIAGVPISIISKGVRENFFSLRTSKIKTQKAFAPALFEIPAGCKKVPFNAEFVATDDQKGAIEDFLK
jgi:hypothetical protein